MNWNDFCNDSFASSQWKQAAHSYEVGNIYLLNMNLGKVFIPTNMHTTVCVLNLHRSDRC